VTAPTTSDSSQLGLELPTVNLPARVNPDEALPEILKQYLIGNGTAMLRALVNELANKEELLRRKDAVIAELRLRLGDARGQTDA
jgi:hypothetical protein